MGSFVRIRDDVEELAMKVAAKLPGKLIIWMILSVVVLVLFVFGFGIGFGTSSRTTCRGASCPPVPHYILMANNSESCPALTGDKLLTTVADGQSFEGLSVLLQCGGSYTPFPPHVRCNRNRRPDGTDVLEWSNLPVCHPNSLVSLEYWKETIHAKSVLCSGDAKKTTCKLQCVGQYVAVEEDPYTCKSIPCKAWTISGHKCYMCQSNCTLFHQQHNPAVSDLLETLSCEPSCDKIVVTSSKGAAVWQNTRTGLFSFVGEHNGRPVYLKNATSEYLYYSTSKTEWLIGDDFNTLRGGINVFNNDDDSCPEKHGGGNSSKHFIDYSLPLTKKNRWTEDNSIQLKCYKKGVTPVTSCTCSQYEVIWSDADEDETIPSLVKYHMGIFDRLAPEHSSGLLAPVYQNREKQLLLFSHHPEGLVWQISASLSITPMRAVGGGMSCPDSEGLVWEYFNSTGGQGRQTYLEDQHVQVHCRD